MLAFPLALSCFLLGCGGGADEELVEERDPDDPEVVKVLEEAGAKFRRDGQESIFDVNLSLKGKDVGDEVVEAAAELEYLRMLNLKDAKITDEGLEPLTNCEYLQTLDLWNTPITLDAFEHIGEMSALKHLRIRKCDNIKPLEGKDGEEPEDPWKPLANLENLELEELDVRYTNINDKAMEHIGKLTTLKNLKLQGNYVTDAGIHHLENLKNLERLDLWGAPFSDKVFDHIEGLDLVQLEIDQTRMSIDGMKKLKQFPNLEILDVYDTLTNDEVVEIIGGMEKMRSLNLRNTPISTDALEDIGKLVKLERLLLGETQVEDSGFVHLTSLKKLKVLDLWEWRTSGEGEGLEHLLELPELTELILMQTTEYGVPSINDEYVGQLAKLPKLEQIVLDRLPITSDAIEPFKETKTLKKISIKGCLSIEQDYVDKLREELPNVEIVF